MCYVCEWVLRLYVVCVWRNYSLIDIGCFLCVCSMCFGVCECVWCLCVFLCVCVVCVLCMCGVCVYCVGVCMLVV